MTRSSSFRSVYRFVRLSVVCMYEVQKASVNYLNELVVWCGCVSPEERFDFLPGYS